MILYGDINQNGVVDNEDLKMAQFLAFGPSTNFNYQLSADQRRRADVDGDGLITGYDVALISNHIYYESPEQVEYRKKYNINKHSSLMEYNVGRNFGYRALTDHFTLVKLFPTISEYDDNTPTNIVPLRTHAEIYTTTSKTVNQQIQETINTFKTLRPGDELPQYLTVLESIYPSSGGTNTIPVTNPISATSGIITLSSTQLDIKNSPWKIILKVQTTSGVDALTNTPLPTNGVQFPYYYVYDINDRESLYTLQRYYYGDTSKPGFGENGYIYIDIPYENRNSYNFDSLKNTVYSLYGQNSQERISFEKILDVMDNTRLPYHLAWELVPNENRYGSSISQPRVSPIPQPPPPPQIPILLYPKNGDTNVILTSYFTFNWKQSVGATSYTWQLSTASDFSSFVYNQRGIGTTSQIATDLLINTQYYWRVKASNTAGDSGWSDVSSFIINKSNIITPPTTPTTPTSPTAPTTPTTPTTPTSSTFPSDTPTSSVQDEPLAPPETTPPADDDNGMDDKDYGSGDVGGAGGYVPPSGGKPITSAPTLQEDIDLLSAFEYSSAGNTFEVKYEYANANDIIVKNRPIVSISETYNSLIDNKNSFLNENKKIIQDLEYISVYLIDLEKNKDYYNLDVYSNNIFTLNGASYIGKFHYTASDRKFKTGQSPNQTSKILEFNKRDENTIVNLTKYFYGNDNIEKFNDNINGDFNSLFTNVEEYSRFLISTQKTFDDFYDIIGGYISKIVNENLILQKYKNYVKWEELLSSIDTSSKKTGNIYVDMYYWYGKLLQSILNMFPEENFQKSIYPTNNWNKNYWGNDVILKDFGAKYINAEYGEYLTKSISIPGIKTPFTFKGTVVYKDPERLTNLDKQFWTAPNNTFSFFDISSKFLNGDGETKVKNMISLLLSYKVDDIDVGDENYTKVIAFDFIINKLLKIFNDFKENKGHPLEYLMYKLQDMSILGMNTFEVVIDGLETLYQNIDSSLKDKAYIEDISKKEQKLFNIEDVLNTRLDNIASAMKGILINFKNLYEIIKVLSTVVSIDKKDGDLLDYVRQIDEYKWYENTEIEQLYFMNNEYNSIHNIMKTAKKLNRLFTNEVTENDKDFIRPMVLWHRGLQSGTNEISRLITLVMILYVPPLGCKINELDFGFFTSNWDGITNYYGGDGGGNIFGGKPTQKFGSEELTSISPFLDNKTSPYIFYNAGECAINFDREPINNDKQSIGHFVRMIFKINNKNYIYSSVANNARYRG